MSVVGVPRTITMQALHTARQLVSCEGVTRSIVRIPDYQVKLVPDGPWHRRGAIEIETACGESIDRNATTLRAYLLDGALCDAGCFSPHERRLGVAYAIEVESRRFDPND